MVLLHMEMERTALFCEPDILFEQNILVIAVDTRGHGRSPGRGDTKRLADDLKGFLDRQGPGGSFY